MKVIYLPYLNYLNKAELNCIPQSSLVADSLHIDSKPGGQDAAREVVHELR